jgi:hypothetical protein
MLEALPSDNCKLKMVVVVFAEIDTRSMTALCNAD